MPGNSSTLTDSVLGAATRGCVWMRTVFNLSVKMVGAPLWVRAHPSGTDTVNRPPGGVNGTNAWLSGMSPAGLLSDTVVTVPLAVAEPAGALPLVPHPASTTAMATIAAATDRLSAVYLMGSSQSAIHRSRAGVTERSSSRSAGRRRGR